ncbi:RNA-guided endonuclease IscB [Streptomyces sp. NPDC020898]|uniref:RNA-guided endonuclease IscB n=1 Tax=Streptomyces sp. NPDC020898 TaxID=3365101 RepID=UPI0037B99D34
MRLDPPVSGTHRDGSRALRRVSRGPRSSDRTRPAGWLAPSVRHRVDTVRSHTQRLCRYAPVTEIHGERAAFDTHSMSAGRPLNGAEYEQGTLAGTNARSYLHTKWNSSCAYCDATGLPLNIDHLRPRSRGGSSRISNLVLACAPCNQAKSSKPVEVFLAHRPDRLAKILQQARTPLQGAAVMNAIRQQLTEALDTLDRPVHAWSGEETKATRSVMGLAKTGACLRPRCGTAQPHDASGSVQRLLSTSTAPATGRRVRLHPPAGGRAANFSKNQLMGGPQLPRVWLTHEWR